jgi:hypothetical protein
VGVVELPPEFCGETLLYQTATQSDVPVNVGRLAVPGPGETVISVNCAGLTEGKVTVDLGPEGTMDIVCPAGEIAPISNTLVRRRPFTVPNVVIRPSRAGLTWAVRIEYLSTDGKAPAGPVQEEEPPSET